MPIQQTVLESRSLSTQSQSREPWRSSKSLCLLRLAFPAPGCARCWDKDPAANVGGAARGSDQTRVSCWKNSQFALAVCGKGETRADVFQSEVRKFSHYRLRGHSARHVLQHVCDSHPRTANAWLPAPLVGCDRDPFCVIHNR